MWVKIENESLINLDEVLQVGVEDRGARFQLTVAAPVFWEAEGTLVTAALGVYHVRETAAAALAEIETGLRAEALLVDISRIAQRPDLLDAEAAARQEWYGGSPDLDLDLDAEAAARQEWYGSPDLDLDLDADGPFDLEVVREEWGP